ncbi:MAG: hypothetical protein AAF733_00230 [Verrucomicrobiota bacterium]
MKHGSLSIWDKAYLTLALLMALCFFWVSVDPIVYLFRNGSDYQNNAAIFFLMASGISMLIGFVLPVRTGFLGGPVLLFSVIPLCVTPLIPAAVWGIFLSFRKPARQAERKMEKTDSNSSDSVSEGDVEPPARS